MASWIMVLEVVWRFAEYGIYFKLSAVYTWRAPDSAKHNVWRCHLFLTALWKRILCEKAGMEVLHAVVLEYMDGMRPDPACAALENNTGLPEQLKAGIEELSGMSLDHVRVHRNSDKPEQLHAQAYALGSEIHLATGEEKHLPHEAWHVVQQAQGRVKPTLQLNGGVPVNDDAGLEKEADEIGEQALGI
jgi:hypothetical protein